MRALLLIFVLLLGWLSAGPGPMSGGRGEQAAAEHEPDHFVVVLERERPASSLLEEKKRLAERCLLSGSALPAVAVVQPQGAFVGGLSAGHECPFARTLLLGMRSPRGPPAA